MIDRFTEKAKDAIGLAADAAEPGKTFILKPMTTALVFLPISTHSTLCGHGTFAHWPDPGRNRCGSQGPG